MHQLPVLLVFAIFISGSIAVSMYPYLPSAYTTTTGEDTCTGSRTVSGSYKFLGSTFTNYYVNPNGFISVTGDCVAGPYIAPFNGDVDFVALSGGGRSAVYDGEYNGPSPVDGLLQIQSTKYILVTWANVGYYNQRSNRIDNFQAVVATDNTDTYSCFIYPDAASTGNPNGGIDWTTGDFSGGSGGIGGFGPFVGFLRRSPAYDFQLPDSQKNSVRGVDGVPGDGPAAIFTGTHSPGQFCFVISGSEIAYLGPATILSPSSSVFSPFTNPTISSIYFSAERLLVSKAYTLQVNGVSVASLTSNRLARAQTYLNLATFPDGLLTLSLIRNSDGATVSVQIVKDTSSFVSITYPTSTTITQGSLTSLGVGGQGEAAGSVRLVISDSSSSTPDITRTTTVDANGNWGVGSLDLSSLADGVIRITAFITDPYGNTFTSNEVSISKDTSVTVYILAPSNQQYPVTSARAGSLTVNGFADVGSTVVVNVNDANAATPAVVSPNLQVTSVGTWSTVLDVSPLSDGLLTIIAVATDPFGNIGSSGSVNLNKDATVYASIIVPAVGSSFTQAQCAAFVISGTGETGGRVSLQIRGETSAGVPSGLISKANILVTGGVWSTTVNISALPNGPITISGTATDLSGNAGNFPSLSIRKTAS